MGYLDPIFKDLCSVLWPYYDALTRQSEESVRIQSSAPACMNSKAEFNAPPIPRIMISVENS